MNDPVRSGMGEPEEEMDEGMEELLAALNTCHECLERVGQAQIVENGGCGCRKHTRTPREVAEMVLAPICERREIHLRVEFPRGLVREVR